MDTENNQPGLTSEDLDRLISLRQKVSSRSTCQKDRPPRRRRTTVKKLLGVAARIRIVADLEDGRHVTLDEVWPSTSQPILDVLNHMSLKFKHDDGDDVVTWDELRNRAA